MKSRVRKEKINKKKAIEVDEAKEIEGKKDEISATNKAVEDDKVMETDNQNKVIQDDVTNDKDTNSKGDKNSITGNTQTVEWIEATKPVSPDKKINGDSIKDEGVDNGSDESNITNKTTEDNPIAIVESLSKSSESETVIDKDKVTTPLDDFLNNKDFSALRAPKAKSNSRGSVSSTGVVSIINSKKNGKRLEFSKELMTELNKPTSFQFAFIDNALIIGEKLPNIEENFNIMKMGKKDVVYGASLIREIAQELGLDYSNGRTSITLRDVAYKTIEGFTIAIIKGNK